MTLGTRIAAVASLSVALAVLAAAIGLYAAVSSNLRGEVDSSLRARARGIVGGGAGAGGAGGPGPQGPPEGAFPGRSGAPSDHGFPGSVEPAPFGGPSGYVEFVSPSGEAFVPGGQGASRRKLPVDAGDRRIAAAGSGTTFSDRRVSGTELRVLAEGMGANGAVLVAQPLTQVEHELSHLLLILALIGAGGVALAALLGAFVTRTALSPITRFTERTERLSGNLDLSRRLEVRGRDELGRLAESFNATLDALERSVEAQRHLVADASHELRTPIASLRANIQTLGDADRLPVAEQEGLRADIIAELDELTALVGDVVELARGAAADGAVDDVRLDELVQAAVASARRRGGQGREGEAGEVRFELSVEPTIVRGQAERIGRAVSNVIDNARKWSPSGGLVEVRLEDGVLNVRDHGPGFQESDLPFVFDRFYRAPAARGLPGSGLGLAIVRQAAEACGGFAEAENAPGGGGLVRVGFGARDGTGLSGLTSGI
ncbi:MAG TPA: HAMP domain-containing sensor histidine kinase [Solirubrobacteraceae bacterium]|jgi:two-component system sensor histidine kinase MprB|nr:HAMP domain-containing sensor histidine kinase [Solirubrobacteraceae bacterium]